MARETGLEPAASGVTGAVRAEYYQRPWRLFAPRDTVELPMNFPPSLQRRAAPLAVVLAAIGAGFWLGAGDTAATPPVAAGPGLHVVDGDTVDADGRRWRLTGFDAPEIFHARCAAERHRGVLAAARLAALIADGARLEPDGSGRRDKYGRGLARLVLPGGGDAGAVMIAAGHARPYDGRSRRQSWCE